MSRGINKVNWTKLKESIPSKVYITPKIFYSVLWVSEFKDETQVGECRANEKQIILKMNEDSKDTVSTFIHEVVHAQNFEYNIKLTERQVIALEHAELNRRILNGDFFTDEKKKRKK